MKRPARTIAAVVLLAPLGCLPVKTHWMDCSSTLFCLLLLRPTSVPCRSSGTSASSFYTFVGASGLDEGKDVCATADGGVVFVGNSDVNIPSLQGKSPLNAFSALADLLVVKLDSTAAVQWYTYLGGPGDELAFSVTEVADGVLVLGTANQNIPSLLGKTPIVPYVAGIDIVLFKLDFFGQLQWYTFLGSSGSEQVGEVRGTRDGGVLVAGGSGANIASLQGKTPVNPYAGGTDGLLVKLDALGNVLWYTFVGSGAATDRFTSILETNSGAVATALASADIPSLQGKSPLNPYNTGQDGMVASFDDSGNVVWYTFLGGTGTDSLAGLDVTPAGDLLVVGDSNASIPTLQGISPTIPYNGLTDVLLIRLSSAGSVQAFSFFGTPAGSEFGKVISTTNEGAIVVGAGTGSNIASLLGKTPNNAYGGGTDDVLLLGLDKNASLQWYTHLGGGGSDILNSLTVTGDGSILLAATADANISTLHGVSPLVAYTGAEEFFLAKVKPDGNL